MTRGNSWGTLNCKLLSDFYDIFDENNPLSAEEKEYDFKWKKLTAYRDKLARLTFLDPACGSGNFLTETYLSLRRLDNEALRQLTALSQTEGQITFVFGGTDDPVKVRISQMYGIEINDFAVTVAKTALWQ